MKYILTCFLLLTVSISYADKYAYTLDLVNIDNDKVKVVCLVPKQSNETVDFIFPNVIPGSYSMKEFGRYIDKFTAFDASGKKLKVKKADRYNFKIMKASSLSRIEYYVNDSWEEKDGKHFIFQPGGTNIEAGKNFVINHYGFFGYIDGMKNLPFEIKITKPSGLTGYSYLTITSENSSTDVISAPNYDFLVDNPVMYCPKDDYTFKIGKSEISLCVYSETGKVHADMMADAIKPVADALRRFFITLPVDKYVFIFYLADASKVPDRKGKGLGSGFGALEHNHCSFYFMPEYDKPAKIKEHFRDVCAHEFLHILTPLNLHSREIEDFNFRTPVMSKHLWMYEGATEYFAQLSLLQDSLEQMKDFLEEMRTKMSRSSTFDKFSMTDMSKNVVTEANQERYLSVYSRGALLAMMLDMLIIDRSDGKSSLRQVLMKLADKYGESKPFNDDDLINDIVAITHPDIKTFFDNYITGSQQPDYAEYFKLIGYDYKSEFEKQVYYFGSFGIHYNQDHNELAFVGVKDSNLGIEDGDILVAINDSAVTIDNLSDMFDKYFDDNESDKKVTVTVKRRGEEMLFAARPMKASKHVLNYIYAEKNPGDKANKNLLKFLGVN